MNEILVNVIAGLITLGLGYILNQIFVVSKLESKIELSDTKHTQQQKEIDELKVKLNDDFVAKLDKLDDKFQKLSVEVAKFGERIEHLSKRPVSIDQGDLRKLLELIVEVQKD